MSDPLMELHAQRLDQARKEAADHLLPAGHPGRELYERELAEYERAHANWQQAQLRDQDAQRAQREAVASFPNRRQEAERQRGRLEWAHAFDGHSLTSIRKYELLEQLQSVAEFEAEVREVFYFSQGNPLAFPVVTALDLRRAKEAALGGAKYRLTTGSNSPEVELGKRADDRTIPESLRKYPRLEAPYCYVVQVTTRFPHSAAELLAVAFREVVSETDLAELLPRDAFELDVEELAHFLGSPYLRQFDCHMWAKSLPEKHPSARAVDERVVLDVQHETLRTEGFHLGHRAGMELLDERLPEWLTPRVRSIVAAHVPKPESVVIPQEPERELVPLPEEPVVPQLRTRPFGELSWEAQYEVLAPHEHGTVYLGSLFGEDQPLLVDRSVLHDHVYVTGPPGSGKTSSSLVPLVTQLIRGTDETNGDEKGAPPPMLIIDMKGSKLLYHTARIEAAKRGQQFHLITTDEHFESSHFDPFQSLHQISASQQVLAEVLCQGLELFHGPSYGPGYFSALHAEAAAKAIEEIYANNSDLFSQAIQDASGLTFEDIAAALEALRKKKHGRDANHAYAAITPLTRDPFRSVLSVPHGTPESRIVDMLRVVRERQVVYVWAPAGQSPIAGASVARLALSTFDQVIAHEFNHGRRRQCYAVVDEFQELAAYNIKRLVLFSREPGLGLILANQSRGDLVFPNLDLRSTMLGSTAVKQFLGVSSPEELDFIVKMSGEKVAYRKGATVSETHSRGSSVTQSESNQSGERSGRVTEAYVPSESLYDAGMWTVDRITVAGGDTTRNTTGSASTGSTTNTSKGVSLSLREVLVPKLEPNDVLEAASTPLASVVRTTHVGSSPVRVQGHFTMDREEYEARSSTPWPLRSSASAGASSLPTADRDDDRRAHGDKLGELFGDLPPG